MRAEAAAFAGNRVNPEIFDSAKTAKVLAQAAFCAPVLIYAGYLAAPELAFLFHRRAKQQMQVGSIHIAVGEHLPFGQDSQGADDTGLAGASLTAQNDKLFHP
jgi:hypothetical protein